MLVANSFDLWQKDTFFSAAEEVQQSADIMESAYRTWLRARREGLVSQHLDELGRELQMALGTAKWQLEEFERAVTMSYRNHGDDVTITRHRQFVSAIQDQISRVETSLKESFKVEGKKPFRWVNLDEDECDDLALFLSGSPVTSERSKGEGGKLGSGVYGSSNAKRSAKDHCSRGSEVSTSTPNLNQGDSLEQVAPSDEDSNCFTESEKKKFLEAGCETSYQTDSSTSNRRMWNSPDKVALEIIIDHPDSSNNALSEATPKEKGTKPSFWRSRHEGTIGANGVLGHAQSRMFSWINQHLRGHRSHGQRLSLVLPTNSIRFILALMLTIFLVGCGIASMSKKYAEQEESVFT